MTANDIDPYAIAAVTLNARANGVKVGESLADLLDGDGGDAQIVLAGDVFYSPPMAERMLSFLDRLTARGIEVLIGDPGRGHLPADRFETMATYALPRADAFADAQLTHMSVLRPRR